jgi:L-2-hydroxycarboxylate dehydrogenase (NAD+)
MVDEIQIVDFKALEAFGQRVFCALGVPAEDALWTSQVLVRADLRGIESHGVGRIRRYVSGIQKGLIAPRARMKIVHETPVSALLDAENGLGQVAGRRAMQIAMEKAIQRGTGWVAVRNSNHFGIAGCYSMMALERDLIGFSTTNSHGYVIPTFGKEPILGTNPLSVAIPAGAERPFVLDMSTAVVTSGRLEVYHRKGKKIPLGWAVDERGLPCDDPGRILANLKAHRGGGILPLGGEGEDYGGHKGYGLDAWADIFSGVLSGSGYLNTLYPKDKEGREMPSRVGHFFGAWRIDLFRPVEEFKRDMDDFIRRLRQSTKAEGQDRIYVHGEKEFELEEKHRQMGIPLSKKVYGELRAIAEELKIPWDL